jgi:hypothetical protein
MTGGLVLMKLGNWLYEVRVVYLRPISPVVLLQGIYRYVSFEATGLFKFYSYLGLSNNHIVFFIYEFYFILCFEFKGVSNEFWYSNTNRVTPLH